MVQWYARDALDNIRFGGKISFVTSAVSPKPRPLKDDGDNNFVHVDVISTSW